MELTNINKATEWFEVLQTTKRAQAAMMTLPPGEATGEKLRRTKKAGVKHRFTNWGKTPAVTFNVYAPPGYPAGTKG